MEQNSPIRVFEKIARIYSERREDEIAMRIRYEVVQSGSCKIVQITGREEFGV
jgi:hypothetical protein